MRLIAITRKPQSTTFQQRVVNYVEPLRNRGIDVECRTLPSDLAGQRKLIDETSDFDGVWWHRHLLPVVGLLPRLRRRASRIVLDFDDPLPFSSAGGGRRSLTRWIKFRSLASASDCAFAASEFLRDLAAPHCRAEIVPMPVDVPVSPPERNSGDLIELLWLGSASTQPYLEQWRQALERLADGGAPISLRLVAHDLMAFGDLEVDFREWSESEQAAALRECDIGLCPMPDSIWTRGKCPYKVLQYMTAAMPWVGSDVGELKRIGREAEVGQCVDDADSCFVAMQELIADPARRLRMGQSGFAYVAEHHGRSALVDRVAALWRSVVDGTV